MKKEEFLKLSSSVFKDFGFTKKGNNFYYDFNDEFLGVFGLQKSAFDAYYYVEFGFAIKSLNPKMPFPKYHEVNLSFGRIEFNFNIDSKAVYYENLDEKAFKAILQEKILWFIEIGKSGKSGIGKSYCEFGSCAIGECSLTYLGLPTDVTLVIPETIWL